MKVRRPLLICAIVTALLVPGAIAVAEFQPSEDEVSRKAILGLDSGRDYPESFLRTAEMYERLAPAESSPGPVIGADEVHVPVGPVPEDFVKSCTASAEEDPSLDSNPLCRAVLLAAYGEIEPGVHSVKAVEARYEAAIEGE
jgi:hypothetical protein